jgi:hypothetical protein
MSAGTTLEAAAGSATTRYPPTGPVKLLPRIIRESGYLRAKICDFLVRNVGILGPKFFRPCPKSGYFRRDFRVEKKSATSKVRTVNYMIAAKTATKAL